MAAAPPTQRAVQEVYTRHAPGYDARWHRYEASTHGAALRLLQAHPGERVLDLGGGTGRLARKLQARGCTPVVADITPAMARQAPEPVLADAHHAPFHDGSFDAVTLTSVLNHLPQPLDALREAHRVLRPGGRLVLVDWRRRILPMELYDAWLRLTDDAHGRIHPEDELLDLVEAAGFTVEEVTRWRCTVWPLVGVRAEKR